MHKEEVKDIRRNVQKLERLAENLESEAKLLDNNGIDTETSVSLLDSQQDLQDEIELLAADLLQLLAETDTIDENDVPLPKNWRSPVVSGNLPIHESVTGRHPQSKTTSASDLTDVSAYSVSSAHHSKTQTSDVDSTNWGDYEIQKNETDGNGIINFKT